ncbi:MAG: SDR family NAD(P)-dependent oxidoreductase [Waddliaceae bacterium]
MKEYAHCLLAFIQHFSSQEEELHIDLADLAYTFQVGREAMEVRVGMIVHSMEELEAKLQAFINEEEDVEDVYLGQVKTHKRTLAVFEADEDMANTIDAWISKRKYNKLLDLWVKGLLFDWDKLYTNKTLKRISAPTYPFIKERYWFDTRNVKSRSREESDSSSDLHPLLQVNTSNLLEQRFSSTFTGEEFFLKDHQVNGEKVLPGVAYLEMALAAFTHACGEFAGDDQTIQLKNVVWARPIIVGDQPINVNIGLFAQENGEIAYEIYVKGSTQTEDCLVHSQGTATFTASKQAPSLNLAKLQQTLNRHRLNRQACYEFFTEMGINYGPAHQGLEQIYIGGNEVLAKLSLPPSVLDTKDQYTLHPSLLDSALQASIGMDLKEGMPPHISKTKRLQPLLPFTLESLDMIDRCKESMWAWIRCSGGSEGEATSSQKLDIDLCDVQGRVCVQMRGFSSRVLGGEAGLAKERTISLEETVEAPVGLITMSPVWNAVPLKKMEALSDKLTKTIIVGGTQWQKQGIKTLYPHAKILDIEIDGSIDAITRQLDEQRVEHLVWMTSHFDLQSLGSQEILQRQNQGIFLIFHLVKALLFLGYGTKKLTWTVITTAAQAVCRDDQINPTHAGVHGFIGSLVKEYPQWKIRLLDMEAKKDWPVQEMLRLPYDAQGNAWAYRNQEWFRLKLLPVDEFSPQKVYGKTGGVYVVIGGAGGIGGVFSQWMQEKYQAHIVWIGRRKRDPAIQEKLNALSTSGPAPAYIQADATDLSSLQEAYRQIKQQHPHIHGVVHSAIDLLDASLANMDEDRFKAGLKAKVDVSVHLARVFAKEPLDFVLFFSSMISFTKGPGQSNYAAGCTFTDAFGHQLGKDWPCAVKIINWGYWDSVGVVTDPFYQQQMKKKGIGSIAPKEGIEVLEKLLNGPLDQLALMRTLKADTMENLGVMDSSERITIYPQPTLSTSLKPRESLADNREGKLGQTISRWQSSELDPFLYKLLLANLQPFLKSSEAVLSCYDRWMEESFSVLLEKGYIQEKNREHHSPVDEDLDLKELWKQWDRENILWCQDADKKAQAMLAEVCLRALPEILTGKRQATDVMFPRSSMELVAGIYTENSVSDLFNDILADMLIHAVQERVDRDPFTQINILEIGAGTGGTTGRLLPKLKPFKRYIGEYCYTDLSKAFLMHAQERYAPAAPYLTTHIFDAEKPIATQQIKGDNYDIVIATNVLHATRNIRQTLRHVKAAMHNGGILLLNEISEKSLFAHLTFGLLEGWWLYEDTPLRIPGNPGLYPEAWKRVLTEEGFISIFFPAKKHHTLGQQIIVAQSDGIVRQQQVTNRNFFPEKNKSSKVKVASVSTKMTPGVNQNHLVDKIQQNLMGIISKYMKLRIEDLDVETEFSEYGFDSITLSGFANILNQHYHLELSPTIFFEYPTIGRFANYLSEAHLAVFADKFSIHSQTQTVEHCQASIEKPRRLSRFMRVPKLSASDSKDASEPIAIVGVSGCFPEACDIHELWRNLAEGKHCIQEIPAERWDWQALYGDPQQETNKTNIKWGGFIDGVEEFDPLFFGISPREAELMDPQQRLMMTYIWLVLEDAGYSASSLSGSNTGIFIGTNSSGYSGLIADANMSLGGYSSTGTVPSLGPNRMSYFLDVHGPSEPIETACSSSLVAIHRALVAIERGECDQAIVGGVNTIITPDHHISFNKAGMLSQDGRCKTFSKEANGYVRGEGVGMLFLKRLQAAKKDEDHIYGLICGSAENHGGRANSLTAPNPQAQADVLVSAYKKAKIDPRTVTYIEAHGTGTALGDPIEINGLKRAFKILYQETSNSQVQQTHCGLGSLKSNIGHLELAAGVAGVIKVLLQFQHKRLVKSLHCHEINPLIDFKGSPFYVVQESREWQALQDVNGKPLPRRAGVSSFGFGGVNAHIVLEEYIPKDDRQPKGIIVNSSSPVVIPLSAKNSERLREYAKHLLQFIQQNPVDLANLAYTLQVGREAMEERLGLIICSLDDLKKKLQAFIDEKGDLEDLYLGQVKHNKDTLAVFAVDEELQKAINKWIEHRKLSSLLALWVKGLIFDWNKLYGDHKPQRITAPTYPFAKERYWVERKQTEFSCQELPRNRTRLHPLVHQYHFTAVDREVVEFTSIFTGKEFFLTDHRQILPGVAYLEMARAAGKLAFREEVVGLANIVWPTPIEVHEKPQEVLLRLTAKEDHYHYQVMTLDETGETSNPVIHSQGKLISEKSKKREDPASLSIQAIQSRCTAMMETEQLVEYFPQFSCGSSMFPLDCLHYNRKEALATLKLPACVEKGHESYLLHPSIMNGALTAAAALSLIQHPANHFLFAFSLESLWIYGKLPEITYAYATQSAKEGAKHYDIDLVDQQGNILVSLNGFTTLSAQTEKKRDVIYATPVWQTHPVSDKIEHEQITDPIFILTENNAALQQALNQQWPEARIEILPSLGGDLAHQIAACFLQVLNLIQALLKKQPDCRLTIMVLVPQKEQDDLYSLFAGLFKTASLEHRRVLGKIIRYPIKIGQKISPLLDALVAELADTGSDVEIRYNERDRREVKKIKEIFPLSDEATMPPLRSGSVIWITGGLGGLGQIFAKHLGSRTGVTIILSGRSPLDASKEAILKAFRKQGIDVIYRQNDLSNSKAVKRLIESIQKQYGSLTGILHAAGVAEDAYILKKTPDQVREVLSPKIAGTLAIEEATRGIKLDFMVLFSSLAAYGNAGQADYAAANAFMDAFATYRNQQVRQGKCHGKTVSLNWPLWKEGGMRPGAETEKLIEQTMGMVAMDSQIGINACGFALSTEYEQILVAQGQGDKIRSWLFSSQYEGQATSGRAQRVTRESNDDCLYESVQQELIKLVSTLQKIQSEQLNMETELSQYGFDSISFTELTNLLNQVYGLELMPTIFFEHSTLKSLGNYLVEHHLDDLKRPIARDLVLQTEDSQDLHVKHSRFVGRQKNNKPSEIDQPEPIAIIGMSGRFPGSENLQAFWQHLVSNHDLISEIPKSRWDWRTYYGDPLQEKGKTKVKWGGFIEDIDKFDPLFFNISPREAEAMDPQCRLFLETAWATIEDAGYRASSLSGSKTGVFVGVSTADYRELTQQTEREISQQSMGTFHFILANRVSYLLDFHGPSEAIDTACSSSLVAIHRAVESIRQGSCEMALVGGVNIIVTPSLFILGSQGGILSEDGRCKTFDKRANGFSRGEGVGAILLKPLNQAVEEGDHIYGLIRGTAENHGGRATSPTAPNPVAQRELLIAAYGQAGIDPRTISYIETHGTGTELGDPIEINGLKSAFSTLYHTWKVPQPKEAHCGLGSVKTNIGHLEAAAGIAGMIKILFMLQHKQIPGNVHLKEQNPYVKVEGSPFYLVKDTQDWPAAFDQNHHAMPRRAGVSSFGVGGANAHVVVEEYIEKKCKTEHLQRQGNDFHSYLIVLSAKTATQLKAIANNLNDYLENTEERVTNNLRSLAYTLQVGREAMEVRLAFLASNKKELRQQLKAFISGEEVADNCWKNQRKDHEKDIGFLSTEDKKEIVHQWLVQGKWEKIAGSWVRGWSIDWDILYDSNKPGRLSLPTYPFARERYWVNTQEGKISQTVKTERGGQLHPLVQVNTSTLSEQRFSSTFTGREFFSKDCYVNGKQVLPGGAYLEMACEAVKQACGEFTEEKQSIQLKDIVWSKPIVFGDQPAQVNIGLFPQEKGEIAYEIYTDTPTPEEEDSTHCQGIAALVPYSEPAHLNLFSLQKKLNRRNFNPQSCDAAFKEVGIDHAPAHSSLQEVYSGDREMLAKLTLPPSIQETQGQLTLHPSLLDAAFQASVMGLSGWNYRHSPLPFSLESLEVIDRCKETMWAWIRFAAGKACSDGAKTLTIDLCDEQGKICVRINNVRTTKTY